MSTRCTSMRRFEGNPLPSAGDLVMFLGCRHATALDRRVLDEPLEKSEADPGLQLLQAKGIEHERAYLKSLEGDGRQVVVIPDGGNLRERVQLTTEALRSGADVVYQAALMDGAW